MQFNQNHKQSLKKEVMAPVRVAGIDWATEAKKRALVGLVTDGGALVVEKVLSPLTDAEIRRALGDDGLEVVAVDTPFGWPRGFVQFVQGWAAAGATATPPDSKAFRYRTTDLVVWKELGKQPLPVSSDRIALTTRSWTEFVVSQNLSGRIVAGGGRLPKTAGASVIEVYPGASLIAFAQGASGKERRLVTDGYKADQAIRRTLLAGLFEQFVLTDTKQIDAIAGATDEESDRTDAFLAALTAIAYLGKLPNWDVRRPRQNEDEDAKTEGWIFFPVKSGDAII